MNEHKLIKLAHDTIDLVVLRALVDQARRLPLSESNRQQLERLTRARDLLAECESAVAP